MEPTYYLCLALGAFMLSLSARQSFTSDAHGLRLSDIPMRVRMTLRRELRGYLVRKVRVTMREGAPAYWFTGSTPQDPDLAVLILDSGESLILPPGTARILENEGAAPPETSWLRPMPGSSRPELACAWKIPGGRPLGDKSR